MDSVRSGIISLVEQCLDDAEYLVSKRWGPDAPAQREVVTALAAAMLNAAVSLGHRALRTAVREVGGGRGERESYRPGAGQE